MKLGCKIYLHVKIVDKYIKRGRNYMVADYETIDETGEDLNAKPRDWYLCGISQYD
jgi:hypothetical protein